MTALEIAEGYYNAFNNKNWEAMLAHLHIDIRHEANQGGVRVGKELFAEFLRHMDDCYDETLTEMVFMAEPTGSRIAVEFVVNGIYKKTDGDDLPEAKNQKYVLPAGAFLEFKKDKIGRITTYYNLPLWMDLVSR